MMDKRLAIMNETNRRISGLGRGPGNEWGICEFREPRTQTRCGDEAPPA
jgi:hypothetical protein